MEKQGATGRRTMSEFRRQEEEVIGSLCRLGSRGVVSPKSQIEQEKRIRREIANSNERRRMQSINQGFQQLRVLLPHRDGEKMSKAAILSHTAEYIYQLENEKTRLLTQQCSLQRLLQKHGLGNLIAEQEAADGTGKQPGKRKRGVDSIESADEGIGMSPSRCESELINDLKYQLNRERDLRKDSERKMQQMMNERDGQVPFIVEEHSSEAEEYIKEETIEEVTEEFVITDDLPRDLSCAATAGVPQQEVTVISKPSVVVLPVHGVNMVAAQQLTPAPSPPRCQSPSANANAHNGAAVTSRQNLDTIVEAIRHLEGDHAFNERRPSTATVTLSDTGARSETVIVRSAGVTAVIATKSSPAASAAERR